MKKSVFKKALAIFAVMTFSSLILNFSVMADHDRYENHDGHNEHWEHGDHHYHGAMVASCTVKLIPHFRHDYRHFDYYHRHERFGRRAMRFTKEARGANYRRARHRACKMAMYECEDFSHRFPRRGGHCEVERHFF